MNTEMQKKALAAREAHLALLDLKKVLDEAARKTHAAELEAVHLATCSRPTGDIRTALRVVSEILESANFDSALARVRSTCARSSSVRTIARTALPCFNKSSVTVRPTAPPRPAAPVTRMEFVMSLYLWVHLNRKIDLVECAWRCFFWRTSYSRRF
jgi:hypothetical protein